MSKNANYTIRAAFGAFLAYLAYGYFTPDVAASSIPQGFDITGEKAQQLFALVAFVLPLFGPSGQKWLDSIKSIFAAFGVKTDEDKLDADSFDEAIEKFKPLLGLLKMFHQFKTEGKDSGEQRAIRALAAAEFDRLTWASDEDE